FIFLFFQRNLRRIEMSNSSLKKQKISHKLAKTAAGIVSPKAGNVINRPNLKAKSPIQNTPSTKRPTINKKPNANPIAKTGKKSRPKRITPRPSKPLKKLSLEDIYYEHFPLKKWVEFQTLEYIKTVSKNKVFHQNETPVYINQSTIEKALNSISHGKALQMFLSERTMTLPPDDRILIWDYLKRMVTYGN
ncbi:hypothetical protein KKA13_00550, partial [Patescibacteria group bacterium]|nr:hypothetical protein [Patescibacteria group bacterium]